MHLSTTAWVIVIVLVLFIITLNLNLIFALKKKHHDGDWVSKLQDANRAAVDPWKKENENFERLGKQVEEFQSKTPPSDEKPTK